MDSSSLASGEIIVADALEVLPRLPENHFQAIVADPPYFQVLLGEEWDNVWKSPEDYVEWTVCWVRECRRVLREDGLLFIFGQLGKREHVWLHVCSRLAQEMQFHDMIVWDRVVGYNQRRDSFTPQYEMILVLRRDENVYFAKEAVREPYDEATIQAYMRDKRYKDLAARETQLREGKYATNIWRIPSLKGTSKEKAGHPSQKPLALVERLIAASTRPNDWVLDPFLGSGSTAVAAEALGRRWVGIERNADYAALARRRLNND